MMLKPNRGGICPAVIMSLSAFTMAASADLLLYYDFEDGNDAVIENQGSLATAGSLNAVSGAAETLFGEGAPTGASPTSALILNGKLGDLISTNLSAEALSFFKPAASGVQNDGRPSTYTASAWARVDEAMTGDHMIFGQVNAAAGGTGFIHDGFRGNRAHLGHYANDTTALSSIQTGQWVHVTYRVANGSRTIFVNGAKDNVPSAPGAGGLRNSSDIIIGASDGGVNRGFVGALDDLMVFDEALADNQIAYLANGGDPTTLPAPGHTLYTAQTGPGGTWNLYQIVGGFGTSGMGTTWWNAHNAAITAPDPSGVPGLLGHLPSIADDKENYAVRVISSGGGTWLGATDNDTAFTTPARTEGTFFWANATSNSGAPVEDSFTYTNWAGGEPNNAVDAANGVTGEDASEMRADGSWNDHRSSIPGTGEAEEGGTLTPVMRNYVIEWDTAAAGPVAGAIQIGPMLPATLPGVPGSGTFSVRRISGFPVITSLYGAKQIIENEIGTFTDGKFPTVNFSDPENRGNRGYFGGDFPFPGDTNVDDNNFLTIAKGRIVIDAAGDYTFGVTGDDNWALRIVGQSWTTVVGCAIDQFDASTVGSAFGGGSGLAQINLTEGTYEIELVHLEQAGGSNVELYAAPGAYTSRTQTQNWRLVGHQAGGTINLPTMKTEWAGNTTASALATQLTTTALAEAALTEGPLTPFTSASLNFADPDNAGGGGLFGDNVAFPNDTAGVDDNDFALEATGTLVIPADGLYQIGFRGDDGSLLTVADSTFLTVAQNGGGTITNGIQFAGTTGDSFTTGSIYLTTGEYTIRTVFFERGGGGHFEVFAGQGFNVELLSSDGATSKIDEVAGIQLVGSGAPLLGITDIVINESGRPSLSFSSSSVGVYTVQRSSDLLTWSDVLSNVAGDPDGQSTTVIDSSGSFDANQPSYFYRVIRE
ncbi:LamG-like jellyroll fold domain-containing protein [Verrucomicrobiaceae bacterium 227]